ncbi:MAG: PD-(D/E)XK nuclease family protein [Truepera sp.]|nr:PD-(D/E)XK nuclease family protein [Truepera sp.]
MARLRQSGPYIHATWAAHLLAGNKSCEWAYQFQALHDKDSYNQAPDSGNWALYRMRHTSLLRRVHEAWDEEGYDCTLENQNSFFLKQWDATLGGKPDLIVSKGDSNIIIDTKTGRPNDSHILQVMVYMYAVPLAHSKYHGVTFEGRVAYENYEVQVPSVDDEFIYELESLFRRLTSEEPARRVPSLEECKWCKITSDDCLERMGDETESYVKPLPPILTPAELPL